MVEETEEIAYLRRSQGRREVSGRQLYDFERILRGTLASGSKPRSVVAEEIDEGGVVGQSMDRPVEDQPGVAPTIRCFDRSPISLWSLLRLINSVVCELS